MHGTSVLLVLQNPHLRDTFGAMGSGLPYSQGVQRMGKLCSGCAVWVCSVHQ